MPQGGRQQVGLDRGEGEARGGTSLGLQVRKVLGWPKRCELAHAFRWEHSYKRLKLAQLLGQLGAFLTPPTTTTQEHLIATPRHGRRLFGLPSTMVKGD